MKFDFIIKRAKECGYDVCEYSKNEFKIQTSSHFHYTTPSSDDWIIFHRFQDSEYAVVVIASSMMGESRMLRQMLSKISKRMEDSA